MRFRHELTHDLTHDAGPDEVVQMLTEVAFRETVGAGPVVSAEVGRAWLEGDR